MNVGSYVGGQVPPAAPLALGDSGDLVSTGKAKRAGSVAPQEKRKRVLHACDECRKKKIKCEGSRPCNHCRIYETHRRVSPLVSGNPDSPDETPVAVTASEHASQVKELTGRIDQLERILRQIHPSSQDLALLSAETSCSDIQTIQPSTALKLGGASRGVGAGTDLASELPSAEMSETDTPKDSQGASPHVHMHDGMYFNGPSSIPGLFSEVLPRISKSSGRHKSQETCIDGTVVSVKTLREEDMPSYADAVCLVNDAFKSINKTTMFSEQGPLLERMFRFYSHLTHTGKLPKSKQPPRDMTVPGDADSKLDTDFIPVFFCILSLGELSRHTRAIALPTSDPRRAKAMARLSEGPSRYIDLARGILDLTAITTLDQLEALGLMVTFASYVNIIRSCWKMIGIGLRAAVQMGMHRKLSHIFPPEVNAKRKKLFWAFFVMDVALSSFVGLPIGINDYDIDQDFPDENPDDCFVERNSKGEDLVRVPVGTIVGAISRLQIIHTRILRRFYKISASVIDQIFAQRDVEAIEMQLMDWRRTDGHKLIEVSAKQNVGTSHMMLDLHYKQVQLVLYRPFLLQFGSRSPNSCLGVTGSDDFQKFLAYCLREGLRVATSTVRLAASCARMSDSSVDTGALIYSALSGMFVCIYGALVCRPSAVQRKAVINAIVQGKWVIGMLSPKVGQEKKTESMLHDVQIVLDILNEETNGMENEKRVPEQAATEQPNGAALGPEAEPGRAAHPDVMQDVAQQHVPSMNHAPFDGALHEGPGGVYGVVPERPLPDPSSFVPTSLPGGPLAQASGLPPPQQQQPLPPWENLDSLLEMDKWDEFTPDALLLQRRNSTDQSRSHNLLDFADAFFGANAPSLAPDRIGRPLGPESWDTVECQW